MEKYKVIHKFKDLEDNDYVYREGDCYPREGLEPTKKRIKELLGSKNKIGRSLIAEVTEEVSADVISEE